jgi:hypothetical protein
MPNTDFRCVHLPYCLLKLKNGRHVVLNRNYNPLGFRTKQNPDFEAYPIAVKFKRLGPATVKKLSYNGSPDTKMIYLYDDGSVPTRSKKNMQEYLERLKILAKLEFARE